MEAASSSESPDYTAAHPKVNLHNHHSENLQFQILNTAFKVLLFITIIIIIIIIMFLVIGILSQVLLFLNQR
jgi:hypothetical protein